jgi:aspartyl-tRNA(Asn)/glutamyl-tRNA(Gln) amidotransferase subunit C
LSISNKQVAATAELAKLALRDKELTTLAGQLQDILDYAEVLAELELFTPDPDKGEDVQRKICGQGPQSLLQEEVLALAPDSVQGQIRVPPVMDHE